MWIYAAVAGLAAVLSGALPAHDATAVLQRVAPVLAFLVGITVVAELADAAQVFDVAAHYAARAGKGRTPRLFALVVALGTLTTIVLSLDTTAVLLTPVVLALAAQLEIDALPFAMAAVWLANTASLLLPVSNLTNLLAANRLGLHPVVYATRMALPQLVAVLITALVLGLRYRTTLHSTYAIPDRTRVEDRALFVTAAAVCVALVPAFLVGVPVQWPALGGAAVLATVYLLRDRTRLTMALVPWRLVIMVIGLFLTVTALGLHGLDRALGRAAGTGAGFVGLLRTAGVGAAASNLANNLPSYLALERVSGGSREQLLALLLGTNLGPLVLLWGSLATLLWRERCRARGVDVSLREFATVGLLGVPLLLLATTAVLVATQ